MLKLRGFLLAWWAASQRSFNCVNFNSNQEIQQANGNVTEIIHFRNCFLCLFYSPACGLNIIAKPLADTTVQGTRL